MSNIGLVIKREYLTRVQKRSFLLLTILMPILFIALMFGTVLLAMMDEGDTKTILVEDMSGEYLPVLQNTNQYLFVNEIKQIEANNDDEKPYARLVITGDLLNNGTVVLISDRQVVAGLTDIIEGQLNNYLSDKKLALHNIPNIKEIIADSQVSINVTTVIQDETGKETESSAAVASTIGMVFTFLIYMFIFVYGSMVMSGVLEEKTNRIVEVMVSSVRPFDLMMGKVIGIGLVGLTQFLLWIALIGIFIQIVPAFFQDASIAESISFILGSVDIVSLLVYFILFFIGGYLIYASLFAAIGSMVNSQEDTQQYMMPITILIVFAFVAGTYSVQNPDGPLAFWTSLIPFTSPIVMMVRLPFGVPTMELISCIALLAVTVVLTIWLAAKIYRTGILMYGKKPTFGEIAKWLKYKS